MLLKTLKQAIVLSIKIKMKLLKIMEQNSRRAEYVKIRNEIAPEDTKELPGDETLETADVVHLSNKRALLVI